jgi:hypothetical protein
MARARPPKWSLSVSSRYNIPGQQCTGCAAARALQNTKYTSVAKPSNAEAPTCPMLKANEPPISADIREANVEELA